MRYPRQPSDAAAERLLAALQRTIWTSRDIWSAPNSRPRVAYGVERHQRFKLSPGPENDICAYSRIAPDYHRVPPVDATMYLGGRDDDVMIRLMHKVIDRQHIDGTCQVLPEDLKRVRVEVCLKEKALAELGVTSVASLKAFRFTRLQRLFFQFKLPTFDYPTKVRGPADLMRRTREEWRARTLLRAGVMAVSTMDEGIRRYRDSLRQPLRQFIRAGSQPSVLKRAPRREISYVCWSPMNQKVNLAFQGLDKRERNAWKKLSKA